MKSSIELSRPYWQFYERCIGPVNFGSTHINQIESVSSEVSNEYLNEQSYDSDSSISDNNVNEEYSKFIAITRQHQAERDRLKKLQLKKKTEPTDEIHYRDISQLNLIVEANLARVPDKNEPQDQPSIAERRQQELLEFYGCDRDTYERIKSLEMSIDDKFTQAYQRFRPKYWPGMPINMKPYLSDKQEVVCQR